MLADTILKLIIRLVDSDSAKDKKLKTKRKVIDKLNKLQSILQKDLSGHQVPIDTMVANWVMQVEQLS